MLEVLPTWARVTLESSTLLSPQVRCWLVFPDHPKEGVHLSQEGQSHSLATVRVYL